MDKSFERIGWLGFMLIVSAYWLVTIHLLTVSSAVYHLMNLIGALCLVANAKHNRARPLFWLNIVWCLVAIVGLLQLGKY